MSEYNFEQLKSYADANYEVGRVTGMTEGFRFVIDEIRYLVQDSIENKTEFDIKRLVIRLSEANLKMIDDAHIAAENLTRAKYEVFNDELH